MEITITRPPAAMRWLAGGILAVFGITSLAAAQTKPALPMSQLQESVLEKSSLTVTADYIIGPEDVLDITVWKNADLSKSVCKLPGQRDTARGELLASRLARYVAGGMPANASWGRSSL